MEIFMGLGNPDEQYASTYHNAGWLALAKIMEDGPASEERETKGKIYKKLFEYFEAGDMVFMKPLTYMNESGKAAREALKKFKAKPEDLVVLHDDSDITIGKYKISHGRNSAGHKGVQSVIDALKTNAFTRIRIGIRPTREKSRQKAGEFALKQITTNNYHLLNGVFREITSVIRERHRK